MGSINNIFDILFSGIAIVILLPFMIPIMIGLKLTGEHDIFYGQPRIGKYGKEFKVLKFATMLKNSPNMAGGLFTSENDPRILPMGKFLRKTKIIFDLMYDKSTIYLQRKFDIYDNHFYK